MNTKRIFININKLILFIITFFNQCFAVNSIGQASDNIFEGANLLTRFFWAACIFAGVFLLTAAISNYKEHRNNPKLIPISTVIVYVILGLAAIMVPFLNRLFGSDAYDTANEYTYINKH